MKLYKALKTKKKLTGEVAKLQRVIAQNNSYTVGNKSAERCDVLGLLAELENKKSKLIELKKAIYLANSPIQESIYLLAELKNDILFWEGLSTNEGSSSMYAGMGRTETTEYVVRITEEQKQEKITHIQNQIDELQEEIDVFNYTTDI